MRRSKIIICASVAVLLFLTTAVGVLAANNKLWFQKEETIDAYVFPITPEGNLEKWNKLETHEKMLEVCQIPQKVLKNISTKGLVETCLNYPLFSDMYYYNSNMEGIEVVTNEFNGFHELYSRSDFAKELLSYYKNIDYGKLLNSNDPYYAIRVRFFDFYMSQEKVLLKLSVDERKDLLKTCKESIVSINKTYSDKFSNDSILYLAACTMLIDDKKFNDLLSDDRMMVNERVTDELAELILERLDFS